MSYYGIRVALFKKDKELNEWSDTEIEISSVLSPSIKIGIGKRKDSFTFSVDNVNNLYFNGEDSFDVDDQIKIWMLKDQTWENMTDEQKNNALVIDGIISRPAETISGNRSIIKITGRSWIESLFDTKIPIDVTGTPPVIIQNILTSCANYNEKRAVTWYSGNPTIRSDDSAHDTHSYYQNYKGVIEMLEEVSSDKFTGDGQYIYWLEVTSAGDKEFHWTFKDNIVPGGHTITEGTQEMIDIKVERNTDDIINTIFYHCGKDAYGNSFHGMNYRESSRGAYGVKIKYLAETAGIAKELIDAEKVSNPSLFNQDANDNFTDDHFPIGYDYTMQFKTRDDAGVPTGSAYIVSNDSEFNNAIKVEGKARGLEATDRLLDLYGAPRYKASIVIPRPAYNTYNLGKVMDVTISSYNLTNYKLRLVETTYDFYGQTLTLEEDEKTALINLVS